MIRNKKGLSPILATVLICVIVILVIAVLYPFVMQYIKNLADNPYPSGSGSLEIDRVFFENDMYYFTIINPNDVIIEGVFMVIFENGAWCEINILVFPHNTLSYLLHKSVVNGEIPNPFYQESLYVVIVRGQTYFFEGVVKVD